VSLLSAVILPQLEQYLIDLAPSVANSVLEDLMQWIETRGKQAAALDSQIKVEKE
jgi:hypothetical protein